MARMIECLLCGLMKPHKSRYLCLACYQKPESKSLKIPVEFRVERDSVEMAVRKPDGPALFPTDHPPGSPEKIKVMQDRFERNLHIHHPGDNLVVLRTRTRKKNEQKCVDSYDDD